MNKVYILSSRIKKITQYSDGVVLTEDDFDPCIPFFTNHSFLKPESIDYIYVKGVLETSRYLRYVIKVIDWMLKPNGNLIIDYFHVRLAGQGLFIYPEDEIAYQISVVFKERIILKEKTKYEVNHPTRRHYIKTTQSLPKNDSIDSWSFGIVSDGRKNKRILEIIDKIKSLHIPNYEVIVCGPKPTDSNIDNVKIVDDTEFYEDSRIPLCKKKNAIINNAKYNNLVIIHDRINFSDDWFVNIKESGNYFDAFAPCILDEETKSKHVIDFNISYGPILKNKISHKKDWSPDIYMDGAIIIIKNHIAKDNLLRPYLHWGEKEDVDFAKRLYINGYIITINHNVVVYTLTYNKKGTTLISSKLKRYRRLLSSYIYNYYNKIIEKRRFYHYLNISR